MPKIKQKVSGCCRSDTGIEDFVILRSIEPPFQGVLTLTDSAVVYCGHLAHNRDPAAFDERPIVMSYLGL